MSNQKCRYCGCSSKDQYRAELYDEVWQKARDMGYANVTDALVELERLKPAPCPTCGECEPFTGSCGTGPDDTRALCRRPAPPASAPVAEGEPVRVVAEPGEELFPSNLVGNRIDRMLTIGTRLYAAPPAAAHGDGAVRKPELVGYFSFCEDKKKWLQQKPKGAEFNHLFTPLYALRAQAGEGGEV